MPIFMSYSRDDEAAVEILVQGFKKVDRKIWYDHDLEGGDIWWDTILRQIRTADVFLFAKSDHSLASKACLAELEYAKALLRPILPVQVGPVTAERSNLLAGYQHVDFRTADVIAGFEVLDGTDRAVRRAGPLPEPLPTEPAIPFAYLGEIRRKIEGGNLEPTTQLEVVDKLHHSLGEETDASARTDIVEILKTMLNSPWRTVAAEKAIRYVLLAHEVFEDVIAGRPPREPDIPVDLEGPAPTSWSEDDARTTFLSRINVLVGEMQAGHARQEARHGGGSTADLPPEAPVFPGVGPAARNGAASETPKAAPEWAFQAAATEPGGGFAGFGAAGADEPPPGGGHAPPEETARETSGGGRSTTTATTERPTPVTPPALIYSRALAIAALVISTAFAVLIVAVGRGASVAIFALSAVPGLVAVITSGAAGKRAGVGNDAGARRSSILGVVWGLVSVAIAVAGLAIILNSPMPTPTPPPMPR